MRTVFYKALKHYYKCVIVDNEIFANILKQPCRVALDVLSYSYIKTEGVSK